MKYLVCCISFARQKDRWPCQMYILYFNSKLDWIWKNCF